MAFQRLLDGWHDSRQVRVPMEPGERWGSVEYGDRHGFHAALPLSIWPDWAERLFDGPRLPPQPPRAEREAGE